jgi:uncharacterized protein YjcR
LRKALESYQPIIKPDPETLRRMYEDQGMGTVRIGRELGFGPSTIRYWLRQDGIKLRTQSASALLRYQAGIARPEDARKTYLHDLAKEQS